MNPEAKITLLTQALHDMLTTFTGKPEFVDQRKVIYTVLTEVHGAAYAYDLAARLRDSDTFPDSMQRIGIIKTLNESYRDPA